MRPPATAFAAGAPPAGADPPAPGGQAAGEFLGVDVVAGTAERHQRHAASMVELRCACRPGRARAGFLFALGHMARVDASRGGRATAVVDGPAAHVRLGSPSMSPEIRPGALAAPILLRRARTADVRGIKALVDGFASDNILLRKPLVTLYETVQEFRVAVRGREVVGCGALHVLWEDLAEIRTIAVHPSMQGAGIGHGLV